MKKILLVLLISVCSFSFFSTSHAIRFLTDYSWDMVDLHCPNEDLWKYDITGGPTNGKCTACPQTKQEIPWGYIKNADKYYIETKPETYTHSCQNAGPNQFISACTITYTTYTYIGAGDDNGVTGGGDTTIDIPPITPPITPPTCTGPWIHSACPSAHYTIIIGDPNPSADDTALSLIGEIDQDRFYQIGDNFSLKGDHHTVRDAKASTPVISTTYCQNSISYTCTQHGAFCPNLPASTTCNVPIPTETYFTLFKETLHPVTFDFKGFTIDQAVPTIIPNPASGNSINTIDTSYNTSSLTIKEIKYSDLTYDTATGRSYGTITARCTDGCGYKPSQKVYFAFTSEVINGDFSKALRAVTVRDLRWKNYFTNGGTPYYLANPKDILVDGSKPQVPVDTLKSGYAVEFDFNTINTILNDDGTIKDGVYLDVDIRLYEYTSSGVGREIPFSRVIDVLANPSIPLPENTIYSRFTSNNPAAVNKFLIKATKDGNNGIQWNWVYYLPPVLSLMDSDSDILLVRNDIKLRDSSGKIIWDYVKVLNSTPVTTTWDGDVFKYYTRHSLLDDFDNNLSN